MAGLFSNIPTGRDCGYTEMAAQIANLCYRHANKTLSGYTEIVAQIANLHYKCGNKTFQPDCVIKLIRIFQLICRRQLFFLLTINLKSSKLIYKKSHHLFVRLKKINPGNEDEQGIT